MIIRSLTRIVASAACLLLCLSVSLAETAHQKILREVVLDSGTGLLPVPAYLGQSATNTVVPFQFFSGFTQGMFRSCHVARDNIVNPILIFGNFYDGGSGETATGGTMTVHAAIEYPIGVTVTEAKFSGVATGTITNLIPAASFNATGFLATDPGSLAITIPNGALFAVRFYETGASGVPWGGANKDTTCAEATALAGSGVVDVTTSLTTIPNTNTTASTARTSPIAIISMTTRPSVTILGDSRAGGAEDFYDTAHAIGNVARSLQPYYAYQNYGVNGESAGLFVQTSGSLSAVRRQMMAYTKDTISQYGSNDMVTRFTNTAAQLEANQQTLQGLAGVSGKPFYLTTIEPDVLVTQSVTVLSSVSTLATATVATGTAAYSNGESLSISGASPAAYNIGTTGIGIGTNNLGTGPNGVAVTVINGTQFTYNFAGGTSPATGTILVSDGAASLTWQSPYAGAGPEAQRVLYNTALRNGTQGFAISGFFDLDLPVESSLNSGKWGIFSPTPQFCVWDGVHEAQSCALIIKNSGVIPPRVFH